MKKIFILLVGIGLVFSHVHTFALQDNYSTPYDQPLSRDTSYREEVRMVDSSHVIVQIVTTKYLKEPTQSSFFGASSLKESSSTEYLLREDRKTIVQLPIELYSLSSKQISDFIAGKEMYDLNEKIFQMQSTSNGWYAQIFRKVFIYDGVNIISYPHLEIVESLSLQIRMVVILFPFVLSLFYFWDLKTGTIRKWDRNLLYFILLSVIPLFCMYYISSNLLAWFNVVNAIALVLFFLFFRSLSKTKKTLTGEEKCKDLKLTIVDSQNG